MALGPNELWCIIKNMPVPWCRQSHCISKELVYRNGWIITYNSFIEFLSGCSAPLSPVVSKASAGAMETHSIFAVGSVLKFLEVYHHTCGNACHT